VHTCNPSTWEAKAGGSLRVQCQPELDSETVSKNQPSLHIHLNESSYLFNKKNVKQRFLKSELLRLPKWSSYV
jgi:hypothetical protein